MKRMLSLFLCVVICGPLPGCGGTAEIKPAAPNPKEDEAALEARRKKSKRESMEKAKQGMQGNAPGTQ